MFRVDPPKLSSPTSPAARAAAPANSAAEAEAIIAAPIEPSYSSAVIVGITQIVEALLLATLGFAIFASYVEPGQASLYLPTIAFTTLVRQRAVQCGAHAPHRAYRTVVQQTVRVLAAWSVVFIALLDPRLPVQERPTSCRASGW